MNPPISLTRPKVQLLEIREILRCLMGTAWESGTREVSLFFLGALLFKVLFFGLISKGMRSSISRVRGVSDQILSVGPIVVLFRLFFLFPGEGTPFQVSILPQLMAFSGKEPSGITST